MSLRLYDIPSAWAALQEALEESGGELTPEIQAAWESLQEEGTAKVDAAAAVLRGMKATSEALAAEIGRLQARKAATEKAEERLRSLVLSVIEPLGGKVKTDRFTVYTTRRTSCAIALEPGANIWELEPRFVRTHEPELNKTEIKKAFEAGETMPEFLAVQKFESTSLTVR